MKKGKISKLLRDLRVIYYTDWIRFYIEKFKNASDNRKFKKENPNVILPPDYLMYESFQFNYRKYYTDSHETASWLINYFKPYVNLENARILDWGCGPGRIIRHLPSIIGEKAEYFGTDYNKKTIQWCSTNLLGISFNLNTLDANLPYPDNFFDVIYGISIFTHLSENMHYQWFNELNRILKPGGILFVTTQGVNFESKLTKNELQGFKDGQIIIRGKVKEGHRTYSAFHPVKFMNKLFREAKVREHVVLPYENSNYPPQDIWIVEKLHKG